MDQRRVVEHGPAADVLENPTHERTTHFLRRVR